MSSHPPLCYPEIFANTHAIFAFNKNQQDGNPTKQAM